MHFFPISELVKIVNIRAAIVSVDGWYDSKEMQAIVSHCNDFIEAYKVNVSIYEPAYEKIERKAKTAYEWLKDMGAGL